MALKRQKIKDVAPQAKHIMKGFYNEQKWYKKFFNKDEYNFFKKRFKYQYPYSSYEAAFESKIIIAGMSTMLREMYSQKKKFWHAILHQIKFMTFQSKVSVRLILSVITNILKKDYIEY